MVDEFHFEGDTPVQEPVQAAGVPRGIVREFSAQGLDKMHGFKSDMLDLEGTLADIKSFGGPEALKKAEKLIGSISEFKPSITMIGQIKAGKTSLVNAIVGMPDLLPSDVNPWTSVVTSIHLNTPKTEETSTASFQIFEQEEWDHLVEKGGRLGELSSRAGADDETAKVREQINKMREKSKARLGRKFELLLGQTHNYKYLDDDLMQRYVCMGDDFGDPDMEDPQGQFADITKSADLYLDAPALPVPLCIRDTPGVNDTFMMREQITINALRTSRICVVVLSATQALSSVDMGLIRLISNVKSREVIIFVNRIDELANPATAIGEIRESILATLAKNNGPTDPTIVFGSAYWGNMALRDQAADIVPDSAASLGTYAAAKGVSLDGQDGAAVWRLSGIPELYDVISERIIEGEGNDMLRAIRGRALNHLQGLQASSSLISLRQQASDVKMVSAETVQDNLRDIEARHIAQLNDQFQGLFDAYEVRVDQAHKRFLDRALESLLEHLEKHGEKEVWQYSPDGLRMLLRSSYHMMRKKIENTCETVLSSASSDFTEAYTNMLSVTVDGFQISPPKAPSFPPPVALGQTIALDLQGSWWSSWWKRRKGYDAYADEFYKLIEAETASMINDMKLTQTNDIRMLAMSELNDFLSEQRGILTDVSQKSQLSLDELNGLFGITAQEEREALFDILFEELADNDAEPQLTVIENRPARPTRPARPVAAQ